ncbi:hypothetical protein CK203_106038 [Vitis vinifera]|uniref:Uncharacterized protein n=1 Tax=Vitis vinifera TaxID=29760 RepID=A0A438C5T0_VITVI|nr:hypothetical protein CK203_106038 [Vitis vinifera]
MSETLFRFSIPLSRVFETFQAMGFFVPLAPRALPDPMPSQFRLDLYSQAMHADTPSPAVPNLIDWVIDS